MRFSVNLVCKVVYMVGIKYVNLAQCLRHMSVMIKCLFVSVITISIMPALITHVGYLRLLHVHK